ncbi:flagellar filament capping protein FliD [Thalassospira mesophila]|uniref:Flagellar hook-associated protein 2 n=1 Tax=Thalassospira mesophila TaxID=1293891 RepID=A0A1Y2L3C9_9PROT|nr:flagellar filament capping protein FliD [Thalassospira mesophila]OSQ39677.1 flagellar hook protein FliD [Thalassospira mesophila]
MSSVNLNNVYVGDNGRIQLSGLSSNIDFVDVVDQMMKARRIPADNLEKRIDANDEKLTSMRELQDLVKDLQSSISTLYGAASFDQSKNTFASKQVFSTSADGNAANLMSVSASNNAATGSYKFVVDQIASKHKIGAETVNMNPDDALSTATNGAGTAIGTGSFTLGTAKGSVQIDVSATDTLKDVRDKINTVTGTTGIQASVVKVADGQSTIILTSSDEGSTNRMTLSDDTGNVLENLGILAVDAGTGTLGINAAQEINPGNDAKFTMDGVSITRPSNDIDDLVDGLSISLFDAEPGMTINVEVEQDLTAAKTAILGFVDSYNAVKSYINEKTYVDPQTNKAADGSVLLGNSTVKSIETSLQQIVGSTPFRSDNGGDSDLAVLAQIGISITSAAASGSTEDTKYSAGTLTLDETKLNDMLINNVDEVAELFNFKATSDSPALTMTSFTGNTGAGNYEFSVTKDVDGNITDATYTLNGETKNAKINGTSLTTADGLKIFYNGADGATETATISTSVGLGARLQFAMQEMLDSDNGSLPLEIKSVEGQNTSFSDKVTRIDDRIANQREVMMNKFINMEKSLAQIKTVQSSLDELMAAGKSDN